jgi:tetratricopeptide (TPR) repeat protein
LSRELAKRLLDSANVHEFAREQDGNLRWQMLAELKSEVDRLVTTDLKAAAGLADRIEQLATLAADPIATAFAEASRARVQYHSGLHSEADKLYESAATAMRNGGLAIEAATIEKHRLEALKYLGRYDEALNIGRAARRHLNRAGADQLAQLETNIGNIYFHLDQYKKALRYYDKARALLSTAGDDAMRAVVDFCRSCVFIEIDKPRDALALLDKVAETYDRTGRSLAAAQTLCQAAYLQYLEGNYNGALANYYKARDGLADSGSDLDIAFLNLELAEILLALNAFDDSISCAGLALDGFSRLGMAYELARSLLFRALAEMGLGEHEQAKSDVSRARGIFQDSGNETLTAHCDSYLAELAIRTGDAAEATRSAEASLRVFRRQKLIMRSAHSRLHSAGAAYLTGDLAVAARKARAALGSVTGLFAPDINYKCRHLIGRVDRDRGRSGPALDNFREAIKIIESMRGGIGAEDFKASFLRDKIQVYEDAINSCLDSPSDALIEEAFSLVESSKSRALADLIARYIRGIEESESAPGGSPAGSVISAETRAKFLKVVEELNWFASNAGLEDDKGEQRSADAAERYRRVVARCERKIAQLFRRMESEGSSFAEIHRMQPATSADLCSSLEEGETAIEYFIAGDRVSAFVADKRSLKVVRGFASRRDVERMLASVHFQIEKFNYGREYVDSHFGQLKRAADEHLAELYDAVFKPVRDMIQGTKVVVIPHGILHYVPFHALNDRAHYVVDSLEVSYAPSAAVLKLCRGRARPQNGNKFIAFGLSDPDAPGIDDELKSLGGMFPDVVMMAGDQATRENFMKLAPGARFLHVASHGGFRRDNPMFSFLKLADSRLNFYSLLDLRLSAEMVTLSACRTGVNIVFPGDELHGLMRGFLYAGAPSLVVSLWAVSDRSTAELMGQMYSGIRGGDTKRSALRNAQLAIKDAYGHPYYWAPFILMGNAS